MTTPTEPGFYWYREMEEDWKVIRVFADGDKLFVRIFGSEEESKIRWFTGEWGPKIEPPDLDGELIETKDEYDRRKSEIHHRQ